MFSHPQGTRFLASWPGKMMLSASPIQESAFGIKILHFQVLGNKKSLIAADISAKCILLSTGRTAAGDQHETQPGEPKGMTKKKQIAEISASINFVLSSKIHFTPKILHFLSRYFDRQNLRPWHVFGLVAGSKTGNKRGRNERKHCTSTLVAGTGD